MGAKRDHWIVISDEDLRYIEDGPNEGRYPTVAQMWEWIDNVRDLLEDGLETA